MKTDRVTQLKQTIITPVGKKNQTLPSEQAHSSPVTPATPGKYRKINEDLLKEHYLSLRRGQRRLQIATALLVACVSSYFFGFDAGTLLTASVTTLLAELNFRFVSKEKEIPASEAPPELSDDDWLKEVPSALGKELDRRDAAIIDQYESFKRNQKLLQHLTTLSIALLSAAFFGFSLMILINAAQTTSINILYDRHFTREPKPLTEARLKLGQGDRDLGNRLREVEGRSPLRPIK